MCVGFDADVDVPSLPYEPDDMMVQKPVELSPTAVVQVGQAQIVAELVREHADAAVLRLDGVVAHPVVAVADVDAAERG